MGAFAKMLGQAAPADTTAVAIYTKVQEAVVFLDQIWICNVTASNAKYRIFHDDDGSTYDTTNALVYDTTLGGNTTTILDIKGTLFITGGTIGVRTDTGDALTFTLYGEEVFTL